ncbi:hypothetical protein GCM10027049_08460 [Mucilaginibacter puniceus]
MMQLPKSRIRKRNILLIVVLVLFVGSYVRHKYLVRQITISGRLSDRALSETSGIAASAQFKDMFYVHNDSGDESRFFMISPDGKLHHVLKYDGNNSHDDCEDIAVGPGPIKGKSYVYVGDIGDNGTNRDAISIYRFEEKKSWLKDSIVNLTAQKLYLQYPDGPKDAETLMIDPVDKLFYIVTKRGDTVNVYTSPIMHKPNDTLTLTYRGKLFFEGTKPFKWITAGDISKDGDRVLIKSYDKVYYWKRKGKEHLWQTLQKKPETLTYQAEKMGEAIGFTANGRNYYTVSEGVYAPIYYYTTP